MGVLAGPRQRRRPRHRARHDDVRAGLGSGCSRLPRLADLAVDDAGWGFFLCTYKEVRAGRSGSEFVILNLQDASGQATAKIMSDVERFKYEFEAGEFVRVEGKGSLYNGQVQLVLSTHSPGQSRSGSAAGLSRGRMHPQRAAADRRDVGGAAGAASRGQERSPPRAAQSHRHRPRSSSCESGRRPRHIHHAYRGGFLEHITKMAEVGRARGARVRRRRGPRARRRRASRHRQAAGAAYEGGAGSYTRDGNLVGHIALGLMLVREDDQRHLRIPDRAARADRTPDRLAPRHPRIRLAGRAEDDRGVHPRMRSTSSTRRSTRSAARSTKTPRQTSSPPGSKRLGRVLYKGQLCSVGPVRSATGRRRRDPDPSLRSPPDNPRPNQAPAQPRARCAARVARRAAACPARRRSSD